MVDRFELESPLDSLLVDDRAVFHNVTPFRPGRSIPSGLPRRLEPRLHPAGAVRLSPVPGETLMPCPSRPAVILHPLMDIETGHRVGTIVEVKVRSALARLGDPGRSNFPRASPGFHCEVTSLEPTCQRVWDIRIESPRCTGRGYVRAAQASAVAILLLVLGIVSSRAAAKAPQDGGRPGRDAAGGAQARDNRAKDAPPAEAKLGLSINLPKAFRGYTLFNPMNKKTTYLIDTEGRIVKTWKSEHNSMHAAYLLENGHLFRVAASPEPTVPSAGEAARRGEYRSSTGTGICSGISSCTTRSSFITTTPRSCPTATCC